MALLVAFQEKIVYVPVLPGLTKSCPITSARLRLTYEDVWLRSSDGIKLHSWFIKLFPDCRGPTILFFFQENARNIAHRLEMVRIMLQRLQCNVFMLPYRGYGASDGYPSQRGIINDCIRLTWGKNAGNIAHRLEMVRIMLQRLQCNVFMLSYRGYGASDGYPSQRGIINDCIRLTWGIPKGRFKGANPSMAVTDSRTRHISGTTQISRSPIPVPNRKTVPTAWRLRWGKDDLRKESTYPKGYDVEVVCSCHIGCSKHSSENYKAPKRKI
ncbi:Alpha/beta-Hydrolases superfamily protein isoform 2 [Hibiscus syriacus]|uniref:Alpha/beta-Hydrolases superfamily protein isoform 2 n=1 Tax=Hibiscus syriacus TaxID=106335 RepID=A0A6A3B915_HIBSY|nr:Alpha/beta-Hydrolases superfamily protein isoform 2 [Hibiscus syriacus]